MKEQIQLPLAPGPHNPDPLMASLPMRHPSVKTDITDELDETVPVVNWEEESHRMKITSDVPLNVQKLLGGNWQMKDKKIPEPNIEKAASACSPSSLEKLEEAEGDREKAYHGDKCLRRLNVPRQRLVPLVYELAKVYPKCSIAISGFFLYPEKGGYMGWHTNSDAPCTRTYISHVKEGEKSFFRYRLDGEYVTSWDKEGWNMRQFEVSKENPLWHCVYAETERLSVGFRINHNLL